MHTRPVETHAHRRRVAGIERAHAIHDGAGKRRPLRTIRTIAAGHAPRDGKGKVQRVARDAQAHPRRLAGRHGAHPIHLHRGDAGHGVNEILQAVELRTELGGDQIGILRRKIRIVWHKSDSGGGSAEHSEFRAPHSALGITRCGTWPDHSSPSTHRPRMPPCGTTARHPAAAR